MVTPSGANIVRELELGMVPANFGSGVTHSRAASPARRPGPSRAPFSLSIAGGEATTSAPPAVSSSRPPLCTSVAATQSVRKLSPASRSSPTLTTGWGRNSADQYDDSCVLVVCDRPSVAAAVADGLSGGKGKRTRGHGLLKSYDCFAFFPPANRRCAIAVTSICGHMLSTDFVPLTESRERDLRTLFSTKTRKVPDAASARLSIKDHLLREAHGRAWLCFWTEPDCEGEAIAFEAFYFVMAMDENEMASMRRGLALTRGRTKRAADRASRGGIVLSGEKAAPSLKR